MFLGHQTNSYLIALSRFLERGSYYGVRAAIVVYAVNHCGWAYEELIPYYLWLVFLVTSSMFVFGLVADLLKIHRWISALGSLFQVISMFFILAGDKDLLIAGGVLFGLGSGAYSVINIPAFLRPYFGQAKKLASATSFYHGAVNAGTVLGIWIVDSYLVDRDFIHWTFYGAALVFALTGVLAFFSISDEEVEVQPRSQSTRVSSGAIIALFTLVNLCFWSLYETSGENLTQRTWRNYSMDNSLMQPMDIIFWSGIATTFFCFLFFFIMNNKRPFVFFRLSFGLLIAAAGFLLLNVDFSSYEYDHNAVLIHYMTLVLAESFFLPAIMSMYVLYSNPKFLTTVFGACTAVFGLIFKLFQMYLLPDWEKTPADSLFVTFPLILGGLGIVFLVSGFFVKEQFSFLRVSEKDNDLELKEGEILD
ncbi:MAG: MFS transporter [bacterium]|nr:MFS transporter [bacterium]